MAAPTRAATPPMAWTTPEPATSTTPWPRPSVELTGLRQPPPRTQFPERGQEKSPQKRPHTKAENFHLSASTPVGMVAVVSMKATW